MLLYNMYPFLALSDFVMYVHLKINIIIIIIIMQYRKSKSDWQIIHDEYIE